ncbi:hypothetical protein H0H93_011691 [Arthromyces matolae]|nr:hypothetical protein H0H93_011691 [Arthromyces matolae]
MSLKRKRRAPPLKGLAPGERLKRSTLSGNGSSYWAWVGVEVDSVSNITPEHRSISCGLSKRNNFPFCSNKYSQTGIQTVEKPIEASFGTLNGEVSDDEIIIISDDEEHPCDPKVCKNNPNCLNYLGQDKWEDEDVALEAFRKASALGDNPDLNTRQLNHPVGLKDSPIFQLQVTFAALQNSVQTCFNPVKLVESLHLRTTEQQDAQEFSKLFMSHLDAEFKKQANPKLKSLITDQFRGKQVYGTLCNTCETTSFHHFSLSLTHGKNNAKLEDRIQAFLEPETLSGDNQYFCSQCDALQDATRYIDLQELPPVLHFSLLRFVYDLSTMERRKSKHSILFPMKLDMAPFKDPRGSPVSYSCSSGNSDVYELRGILLHKGSSAHHGHYEAQIYDEMFSKSFLRSMVIADVLIRNKSWYQFNDETVTRIKTLGERSPRGRIVVDDDSDESSQTTTNPAKKLPRYITSKDAYMLIYARKNVALDSMPSGRPIPPTDTLEVVDDLNTTHEDACRLYNENLSTGVFMKEGKEYWKFIVIGRQILSQCRQALSAWLSYHLDAPYPIDASNNPDEGKKEGAVKTFTLDDILCVHGAIDPAKAENIKRLNGAAYRDIVEQTGCNFKPHLTESDICDECVQHTFKERLYQIEHPQLVARFDQLSESSVDSTGFWISKAWVKDWRLVKPKMHVVSEGDPAPDTVDFATDVAAELLQNLYPSWNPVPTTTELCAVCDAAVHISRESKREKRKQAEEEKVSAILKDLYNRLDTKADCTPNNVSCPVIPLHFAEKWRKWLNQPSDCSRPEQIDNSCFICEHGRLNFDPNVPEELDSSVLLISKSDWDALQSLYTAAPLITMQREGQDNGTSTYIHEPLVCTGCRMRRKKDWASARIIIHRGVTGGGIKKQKCNTLKKGATYSGAAARQSRRLRQVKELEEKRYLTIFKTTTVKEIKVMIQKEFSMPTICQRLFHRGKELDENSATVDSLEIFAGDILDLRREDEVVDLDSEPEVDVRPRDEGRGFSGTLLGRSEPAGENATSLQLPAEIEKICEACTFSNEAAAISCTVCDTLFIDGDK